MKKGKDGIYNKFVKRILDLILAAILVVPAFLIVFFCCATIKIETKGPAFFVQERPGYNGKIFKIYKLRTMLTETENEGKTLTNTERVTKVGAVIRKFSFDELPQIWNVICGQMSFIGNRPLLKKYLPLYTTQQMRRHEVRPGISGWAQVNGRNEISWEQKFEKDIYYVDNVSLSLDIKILFMTIANVIKHRGINAGENETMYEFTGSNDLSRS